MVWSYNAGILFLLIVLFSKGFHVRAELSEDRNTTNGSFLENTRYCDCPPLTEFDTDGNHKWEIDIIRPSTNLCGARYSCRTGYQSISNAPNDTRFCFSQDVWNHTEIECREIDQAKEESTILFVAVPSSLLFLLFIGMVIFVLWWQRRAKHQFVEGKLKDMDRSTGEIHIIGETNTNNTLDGRKLENTCTINETETAFQTNVDKRTKHVGDEGKFGNSATATVNQFYLNSETDNKETCKQRCMSEIPDRITDLRKII